MANSKKRCAQCKKYFNPETGILRGAQFFCSHDHLIEYATSNSKKLAAKGRDIQAKEERKELKRRKESLRSLTWYKEEAQKWVNKFIRLRDRDDPCISCGRNMKGGGYTGSGVLQAGHYRSRGACSSLRYHEDNIHGQCAQCNERKSGNAVDYRIGLVRKIGLDRVEWLESQPKSRRWTQEELENLISKYKLKCKEIESLGQINN